MAGIGPPISNVRRGSITGITQPKKKISFNDYSFLKEPPQPDEKVEEAKTADLNKNRKMSAQPLSATQDMSAKSKAAKLPVLLEDIDFERDLGMDKTTPPTEIGRTTSPIAVDEGQNQFRMNSVQLKPMQANSML